MGGRLVKAAFDTPRLRSTEKFVLVALAYLSSDETCSCRASLQDIAEMVGLDRQTVFRAVSSLERAGLVEKTSKERGKACEILMKPMIATIGVAPIPVGTVPIPVGVAPTVVVTKEETAPSLEERSPTPPKEDNPTSKEEKETPQTPRESQESHCQVDLWGNPIEEPSDSSGCDFPREVVDMFDEFWEQYPLKESREVALKTFSKLLSPKTDRRAFIDTVLASIEIERKSTRWKNGEYVSPVDWLKKGEWCLSKFAAFWEKYPRKVAKADALKAFKKLIGNKQDVEWFMSIVMSSLERWAKNPQWTKDGGKFIPYPATWLNRGSWEDSKEKECGGRKKFVFERDDLDSLSDEEYAKLLVGD